MTAALFYICCDSLYLNQNSRGIFPQSIVKYKVHEKGVVYV